MLTSMDFSRFDTMEAAELRSYLAFLLWHYRVVDGFWFLHPTEEQGLAAAEQLNEPVWSRVSDLAARDLISRFQLTEGGLEGFLKVLRLYPWTWLLECECKEMHRREFLSIAGQVDPAIQAHCDFAPPGERPADHDCLWRFTL